MMLDGDNRRHIVWGSYVSPSHIVNLLRFCVSDRRLSVDGGLFTFKLAFGAKRTDFGLAICCKKSTQLGMVWSKKSSFNES